MQTRGNTALSGSEETEGRRKQTLLTILDALQELQASDLDGHPGMWTILILIRVDVHRIHLI